MSGWVRLISYTVPPENLLRYRPWYLCRAGVWDAVDVREIRMHGDGFVARLADIADRDAASAVGGSEIGVLASSFPPAQAGEYYWRDLIGLCVVNGDGTPLGVVQWLIETGAHDVLVVSGEQQRLIPFVRQFVTEVLPDQKLLRVDWTDVD